MKYCSSFEFFLIPLKSFGAFTEIVERHRWEIFFLQLGVSDLFTYLWWLRTSLSDKFPLFDISPADLKLAFIYLLDFKPPLTFPPFSTAADVDDAKLKLKENEFSLRGQIIFLSLNIKLNSSVVSSSVGTLIFNIISSYDLNLLDELNSLFVTLRLHDFSRSPALFDS